MKIEDLPMIIQYPGMIEHEAALRVAADCDRDLFVRADCGTILDNERSGHCLHRDFGRGLGLADRRHAPVNRLLSGRR